MEIPPSPFPERSKRLHNFTLPYLRWGQQRFLRCVNLPSHSQPHHRSPPSSTLDHASNRSVAVSGVSKGGASNGEVVTAARPWNLRTRRAACSEPGDESPVKIVDSLRRNEIGVKGSIFNEDGNDVCKSKFSVSLLREEIEEDYSSMIGKRLPKRPKKRARIVQKKMNTIFPGLWLAEEVSMDSYNVPEAVET